MCVFFSWLSLTTFPPPSLSFAPVTDYCGDGNIIGDEECDDANSQGADGCSENCTIEADWTCETDLVTGQSVCERA